MASRALSASQPPIGPLEALSRASVTWGTNLRVSGARPAARQALLSLIPPVGDGQGSAPKLDVRQRLRSDHGSDLLASDIELVVEAKGMFRAMDTGKQGYLTIPQMITRLGDFGLHADEVQHLSMLMDADLLQWIKGRRDWGTDGDETYGCKRGITIDGGLLGFAEPRPDHRLTCFARVPRL